MGNRQNIYCYIYKQKKKSTFTKTIVTGFIAKNDLRLLPSILISAVPGTFYVNKEN